MDYPAIKILSFDLTLLGELDLYTSLEHCRSWQSTGSFTLTVCGYDNRLMCKNNIIIIGDDPHRSGIIRTVSPVSGKNGIITTISGQTLNGLTSQRTLLPRPDNNGYFSVPLQSLHGNVSAEEIIKTCISFCLGVDAAENRRIVDDNGRLMLSVAENRHRGYPTEWGCRYTQLDDELQAIGEYCDGGYEIYPDLENRQYIAEYLQGTHRNYNNGRRSPVILSLDFESVSEISYTEDFTSYRNIAYCGGKGEGDARAVIAVTNDNDIPGGIDRFETFIDCGELEIAETDTALSLSTAGKHKLEEYNFIQTMTAVISQGGSFRYGEHWFLGDLVTICDNALNLMQDIRISEVTECWEPGGYSLTVTLGKPPKRISRTVRRLRNEVR